MSLADVNTSDADIVAAYATPELTHAVTRNPLLGQIAATPGTRKIHDSSSIPGHIKDLTVVNSATLAANPAFGKALVGAWFEVMAILESPGSEGQKMRAMLGEASGTDRAGHESQLARLKMSWKPADAVAFVKSAQAYEAMDSVRRFSFDHGLPGEDDWFRQSFEILPNKIELTAAMVRTIRRERQLTRAIIATLGARTRELRPAGDVDAESPGLLCFTCLMGITQSWLFAPKLFSLAGRRDFFRTHLHGMLGLSR